MAYFISFHNRQAYAPRLVHEWLRSLYLKYVAVKAKALRTIWRRAIFQGIGSQSSSTVVLII
jgi:hypothetical protein